MTLLISWKSFEISNAIATIAILVLLFAIADLARARRRAIEPGLYERTRQEQGDESGQPPEGANRLDHHGQTLELMDR